MPGVILGGLGGGVGELGMVTDMQCFMCFGYGTFRVVVMISASHWSMRVVRL